MKIKGVLVGNPPKKTLKGTKTSPFVGVSSNSFTPLRNV